MDTQDIEFWQERITESKDSQDAPGIPDSGWVVVDKAHKIIIERYIKKDDKVLDAGCGVGRVAGWFENYTGFDFVPEFVEIAQQEYPEKRFVVADLKDGLPFKDKEFDWVIAISLSNWEEFKEELRRVALNALILNYGKPEEYEII